ncbi:hypothetical protein L202_03929 [Cryptococcus amylolentus CBS 6039]|uniref:Uncharacterized protein n=1 Tax=Cryptococcus amylolentus CBS 6039 TaxID=1295533 RepID=A0A1E3HPM9_9TREE|nr:hypothetical protein L202_03929 [Cryptococcus amylolentus CBS 6039]ODN78282.1 hypothetical protein L202_03929 [Cryptococcus amylolentus CBS 6039]
MIMSIYQLSPSPTSLSPLPNEVIRIILDFYLSALSPQSSAFYDLLHASRFCYNILAPRLYEHVTLDKRNSERFFEAYCDSLLREGVSFVPSSTAFPGREIIYKPIPPPPPSSRGSTHPSALIRKVTLVDGAAVIRCQIAREKIQTRCSLTLQPPPTERPSVALFPNLEWLVIPSSMRGNVTLTREGHTPSFHTREEPPLRSYDALQDIDALQPPRLCITESPHTSSVQAINRAYFFAKYPQQLEELSIHGTRGRDQSFMSQNRTRVLNVAFAIPEAGERNEEGGEETQVYDPEIELGWHLDMLDYSERDLRPSLPLEIVRFFNCTLPKQRVLERIRERRDPVPSWLESLQVYGPGEDHGCVCEGCGKSL